MCSPRAKGVFPENIRVVRRRDRHGRARAGFAVPYMGQHPPRPHPGIGTRLGEPTSFWNPAMIPADGFIQVDIDPEGSRGRLPEALTIRRAGRYRAFGPPVGACPAARPTRRRLASAAPAAARRAECWLGPAGGLDGRRCSGSSSTGSDCLVLAECGNSFAWATHHLRFAEPGRYRVSTGVGAMGHCAAGVVGAAIGGRPGRGDRRRRGDADEYTRSTPP